MRLAQPCSGFVSRGRAPAHARLARGLLPRADSVDGGFDLPLVAQTTAALPGAPTAPALQALLERVRRKRPVAIAPPSSCVRRRLTYKQRPPPGPHG